MSDNTIQTEYDDKVEDAVAEEPKRRNRKPKSIKVRNASKRPITLYATAKDRCTILPTESAELHASFMDELRKNKAAMAFFESGDLVEE